MYLIELTYRQLPETIADDDQASHAFNGLLGSLRMNGQIVGREGSIARSDTAYVLPVICPETTSLDVQWDNKYVRSAKATIAMLGLRADTPTIVGYDIDAATPCECVPVTAAVLTTNYLSLESPLRCGDCFGPIPLYRLPKTYDDEYYNVMVWQSNYQACDTLFMNCNILECATNREMSQVASALSQAGSAVCHQIEQGTGIPTYYHLKTHYGRSETNERQRRCPKCGGAWLLRDPWHRFDFKCNSCRLVGNIAYAV